MGTSIKYQGLRVEDTPQTQICRYLDSNDIYINPIIVRHFMEVAQFIDSALSENGKVFVNCVFGRSRYLVVIFTIITIIALTFSGKNLSGQNCKWLEGFQKT